MFTIEIMMNSKIGFTIKKRREQLNISQGKLAKKCGWENRTRVSNYELGKREPSLDDIVLISHALECSIEYLAGESDAISTSDGDLENKIPNLTEKDIVNWIKYGKLPPLCTYSNITMDNNFSERIFSLEIIGDAMISDKSQEISLYPGDKVIVDPELEPKPGCLVVVKINDDDIKIRAYQKDGSQIILKAHSRDYPPFVFNKHMEILGIIVKKIKITNLLPTAYEIE